MAIVSLCCEGVSPNTHPTSLHWSCVYLIGVRGELVVVKCLVSTPAQSSLIGHMYILSVCGVWLGSGDVVTILSVCTGWVNGGEEVSSHT